MWCLFGLLGRLRGPYRDANGQVECSMDFMVLEDFSAGEADGSFCIPPAALRAPVCHRVLVSPHCRRVGLRRCNLGVGLGLRRTSSARDPWFCAACSAAGHGVATLVWHGARVARRPAAAGRMGWAAVYKPDAWPRRQASGEGCYEEEKWGGPCCAAVRWQEGGRSGGWVE